MNIIRLTLIALTTLVASAAAQAQNGVDTPYSRFGYGVLGDYASSSQKAMGGVGVAMNNSRQINVMNPASYAAIDTLTFLFDIGVDFRQINSSEIQTDGSSLKGKKFTAGLDYITMQFPLGKYMGGSIGLLPYSKVGYSFGQEILNGEDSHQGSGGINELYLGVSGRLFKGFTIGANISYLFGNIVNDTYLMSNNGTSLYERVVEVRDYNLRLGAQYSVDVDPKNRFTLGLTYTPPKDFRGQTYAVMYDINSDTTPDTIADVRLKGHNGAPATYAAGLSWQWNKRLYVEVDYTYQPWKNAKFYEFDDFGTTNFSNRWKFNVGAQYTPDFRGGYLRRVTYRAGVYFDNDYVMVRGNQVKDLGVTVGLGLPAPVNRWTKTVVNLGFEYRRRTSSPVTLVKENYFGFTVGINFNELWFWQNKIQ